MRILFVSPFLPYPPIGGGHAQAWAWLRRLASSHQTAFVGFYERKADAHGEAELARHCGRVTVRLRRPTPHAYSSLAQLPRLVTEFYSDALARDVAAVARGFRPDVTLFLSTSMAQYGHLVNGSARVVTALDVSFVAHRRLIGATRGLERMQARCEWLRMLRYETKAFRAADGVVTMSARDSRIVQAVAPRAVTTAVPPGVDSDRLAPRSRHPVRGAVLYVGLMEHLPNLDGLLHLYTDIWPRVRLAVPEARLTVVGRGTEEELARAAPETLAAMRADPSIKLAGFIPDLAGAMDVTAAMAAPLRLGSGVRNKVVEAMAVGLPVVTTRRGAEGLSVAHGREVLLADDADRFARELVRLLNDSELQERLSAAGRELAAREHDNDLLAGRLESALANAAEARW